MRKLSLFIIAAGATLGVALAQAEDAVEGASPDTGSELPEVVVDPAADGTGDSSEYVDPVPQDEENGLHPIDQVIEVTDETGTPAEGSMDPVEGTEYGSAVDGAGTTDETGGTVESGDIVSDPVKYDDTQIYTTTSIDAGSTRGPEGCMECRTLTGTAGDGGAVEAPAPEVMADVLDGNATGVDVMDPADARKRK